MKQILKPIAITLLLVCVFLGSGCASIVSGRNKNVNFVTNPSGAKFTIIDEKGAEVATGVTPQSINLRTGKAYFRSKKYSVRFELEGHAPQEIALKSKFNGWYIGNILFGGLIGILIVDPMTGAVYTLHKEMVVDMAALKTQPQNQAGLRITTLSALPESTRSKLVRIDAGAVIE